MNTNAIAIEGKDGFLASITNNKDGYSITVTNSGDPSYRCKYHQFKNENMAVRWAQKLLRQAAEDAADVQDSSSTKLPPASITSTPAFPASDIAHSTGDTTAQPGGAA